MLSLLTDTSIEHFFLDSGRQTSALAVNQICDVFGFYNAGVRQVMLLFGLLWMMGVPLVLASS